MIWTFTETEKLLRKKNDDDYRLMCTFFQYIAEPHRGIRNVLST